MSFEKMTDYSDKELLEIFADKDRSDYAFNLIVRKYQERLYWHIRKIVIDHDDTDDVLQNTFIKVWRNLDNFKEQSNLFTWLYRIATNESITFLNKKRRRYFIPIVDVENNMMNKLEGDDYFNGDEAQLKLQKAILSLPEKQRIVFNMKYYDDMKYNDMAEILGQSVGGLKASYHHAVKKIEKYIKQD